MIRSIPFHMAVSIFIASAAAAALAMPLTASLADRLYEIEIGRLDLSSGSIGSQADDSVPIARSIKDMGEMETFTLEVSELDDGTFLDDTYYHRVKLDSSEKVAVLLNKEAIQELDDGNRLRLPVGRWVKWEHSAKERSDYKTDYKAFYTDFSYYVNMEGDFGRVPSISETSSKLLGLFMALFGFPILGLIRWIGVKRKWFPPEFFNKKYEEKVRETQAIDATEQWALAVCAIETSRIGDRNFIAGLPKTLRNQKKMKKILAKHWEIYDEEEARNQIAQLPAARGYLGVERLQ